MATDDPIQTEGLCHAFGKGQLRRQILYDITTSVPAGEIVIVTGPSGSGKSTLLTLIGALRAAQDGEVRVLEENLRGARPAVLERVRRRIGFIFQQHNLLPALTARQNVELGVRVTGKWPGRKQRQRAAEMLEAVGLGAFMGTRPGRLSGGQRQRVAIARALAPEPAILLADEPTASLDSQSGRDVVDRMQTLARQQGTTILLVTHDNRILDIADRILHLEDGRLSTFTEAVLGGTRHLLHTLAENQRKQSLDTTVAALDETGFRRLLNDMTRESEQVMATLRLAENEAVGSMIGRAIAALTRRVAGLLDVERASFFLVDQPRQSLVLTVSEDADTAGEAIRIPLTTGIAGAAAQTGKTLRVDDAYAHPRFNPTLDRATGFQTRSVLAVPIRNARGDVFAVAQLLNRRDGRPFEAADEQHLKEFLAPLGVMLETWQALGLRSRNSPAGDGE